MGEVIDLEKHRRKAARRKARRDGAAHGESGQTRPKTPDRGAGKGDSGARDPEKTPKK